MTSVEKPVVTRSKSDEELMPASDSKTTQDHNSTHDNTANESQVNLLPDNDNLKGGATHVAQNAKASNDDGSSTELPPEHGGQAGLEPTRYGDWEKKGRCTDF